MKDALRFALKTSLFLSLTLLWSACSRPAGDPAEVLIRSASGTSYLASCLQEQGPDHIDKCEFDPATGSIAGTVRGIGGGSASDTAAVSPNYVHWNIFSFQQKQICNYLFGSWNVPQCFALFGYSQPTTQPPTDGWCDPYNFNPIYYFLFPRHCYQEPVPQGTRVLEIRREPVNIHSNERPESQSIYILATGELYSEYCPNAQIGPAVDPGPCEQTFHQKLSSETVRLINLHLDRAKGTGLVTRSSEVQCFAAPQHRFRYKGRKGTIQLRNWEFPCGTDSVNESVSGGVLIRFLDLLWDHFGDYYRAASWCGTQVY